MSRKSARNKDKSPIILTPEKIKERAKRAIINWYKMREPGEPSKPRDVARALGMDPRIASLLCQELTMEGVLGKAPMNAKIQWKPRR